MDFMNMVWHPQDAIKDANKKKKIGESIGILVVAAIIFGIGFALIGSGITSALPGGSFLAGGMAVMAIVLIVTLIIMGLISGFFLQKVMEVLGTDSSYFAGVSTVAYAMFLFAIGILIAGVLSFIPIAGIILALIIATPFFMMGVAAMYQGLKVFFKGDLIAAIVGMSSFMLGFVMMIYLIMLMLISMAGSLFNSMAPSMMM